MSGFRIRPGWVGVLFVMAVLAGPVCGSEPSTGRLVRIEEEIAQTAALLADTTNDAERAQWQRRLDLLQQDCSNLQMRFSLDAQEQQLAVRQKRNAAFALRQAIRNVNVDSAEASREAARLDEALRGLRKQRAELEKTRPATSATGDTAEQQADVDQQVRLLDEEIVARVQEREALDVRLRLIGEVTRIEEVLRSQQVVNPRITLRLLRDKQRQLGATQKEAARRLIFRLPSA